MDGCGLLYEWHGTQRVDLINCVCIHVCIVHESCSIWYM